jgi:predicted MPP superfamily phosphohydrolase
LVRERAETIIFLTVFTLIYTALHLLVCWRVADALGKNAEAWWVWLGVGGALLFPVAMVWEKTAAGAVSRVVYWVASVEMGLWWIALGLLPIFELAQLVFPIPIPSGGWGYLGVIAVVSVYALVEGSRVRVVRKRFSIRGMNEEKRVVQVTDIHCGTIHQATFLKRLVARINHLSPEVVLMTGDLFDGSGPVDGGMLTPLEDLKAPVFFCTGNHENYEGLEMVEAVLGETKIRVLRNEAVLSAGLQIVGVDHPEDEREPLGPVLKKISLDAERPTILMRHAPRGMDAAAAAGIDLQLSGHSHHGQIFPFSLLVRMVYPHGFGESRHGSLQLYCSPGTGTWGPPMRLGSRNEITLITLTGAS